MLKVYLYLRNLWESEEGQDLIEYALLFVFIVIAAAASLMGIGDTIGGIFTQIGTWLTGVAPS